MLRIGGFPVFRILHFPVDINERSAFLIGSEFVQRSRQLLHQQTFRYRFRFRPGGMTSVSVISDIRDPKKRTTQTAKRSGRYFFCFLIILKAFREVTQKWIGSYCPSDLLIYVLFSPGKLDQRNCFCSLICVVSRTGRSLRPTARERSPSLSTGKINKFSETASPPANDSRQGRHSSGNLLINFSPSETINFVASPLVPAGTAADKSVRSERPATESFIFPSDGLALSRPKIYRPNASRFISPQTLNVRGVYQLFIYFSSVNFAPPIASAAERTVGTADAPDRTASFHK